MLCGDGTVILESFVVKKYVLESSTVQCKFLCVNFLVGLNHQIKKNFLK